MIANHSKSIRKKLVKVDTPRLLEEISKRPILFDSTVKNFKKYNLRTKEWAQLGTLFNIKGPEAKVRWRSVRDGFLRHIRRTESNERERGNWIYFEEMKFFMPHIKRKRKKNNIEDSDSISNKSFEFQTYSPHDSSFHKGQNNHNKTEIANDTSNYGILIESLDQGESTIDGELNETDSTVYVQPNESIDEEDVHYEPEQAETYCTPSPNCDLPTTNGFHHSHNASDDNEKFLQSCLPTLRRLNVRKNMLARLRIQQILFDIEFNENG